MMEKFNGMTDEKLVFFVKKENSDAIVEILERYKYKARALGRSMYHQYKSNLNADADDLYNCALNCVIIACKTYQLNKGNFESYWKTLATNELYEIIKNNCDSFLSDNKYGFVSLNETDEENLKFAKSNLTDEILYNEMVELVKSRKANIDRDYAELFIKNLEGYSINDLAIMYNLKYSTVYYRIESVRKRLEKILLHS